MQFHLSFFESVSDNASKKDAITSEPWSWAQICEHVANPVIAREKSKVGLWNGCRFGDTRIVSDGGDNGSLRHVANAIENSLLFFDYDSGETFGEAVYYWQDMQCAFVAHTSFSHAPEHHKFRIIVPLVTPVPAPKYKALWRTLAAQEDAGGQKVDRAPSSPVSIFYRPAHKRDAEYLYYVGEGAFLDWSRLDISDPPRPAPPPPHYVPGACSPKRAAAYLTPIVNGCTQAVATADEGTGNITLRNRTMVLAGYLHYGVYTERDIEHQMEAATAGWSKRRNITSTIRRAIRDGYARPLHIPDRDNPTPKQKRINAAAKDVEQQEDWEEQVRSVSAEMEASVQSSYYGYNDEGFLNRFAAGNRDRFYYVPSVDKWLSYNGIIWDAQNGDTLLWEAMRSASHKYEQEEIQTAADPEKCQKFFARYRNSAGLRSVTEFAKHDMRFRRAEEDFNKNNYLIACQNGVLDLATLEFRPGRPSDLLTFQIPTIYDPDAKCPLWEEAILRYMGGDEEMVEYFQRISGYCITGDMSAQEFYIWQGSGGNGKGTVIRLFQKVLGTEYLKTANSKSFYHKEFDHTSHSDHLAVLTGARIVVTPEGADKLLDEELVKAISGQDNLLVSLKGKSFVEITPTYKLIFTVNKMPVLTSVDTSFKRRVRVIKFDTPIADQEKKDAGDFEKKLAEEAAGVFNWMVAGLRRYQQKGTEAPDSVMAATNSYRMDMNPVQLFLDLHCNVETPPEKSDLVVGARKLYDAYKTYQMDSADSVMSEKAFSNKLDAMKFPKINNKKGAFRQGIELVESASEHTRICADCRGTGMVKLKTETEI